jgi:hypothetical protein
MLNIKVKITMKPFCHKQDIVLRPKPRTAAKLDFDTACVPTENRYPVLLSYSGKAGIALNRRFA